jgi:hypothetical protein
MPLVNSSKMNGKATPRRTRDTGTYNQQAKRDTKTALNEVLERGLNLANARIRDQDAGIACNIAPTYRNSRMAHCARLSVVI